MGLYPIFMALVDGWKAARRNSTQIAKIMAASVAIGVIAIIGYALAINFVPSVREWDQKLQQERAAQASATAEARAIATQQAWNDVDATLGSLNLGAGEYTLLNVDFQPFRSGKLFGPAEQAAAWFLTIQIGDRAYSTALLPEQVTCGGADGEQRQIELILDREGIIKDFGEDFSDLASSDPVEIVDQYLTDVFVLLRDADYEALGPVQCT